MFLLLVSYFPYVMGCIILAMLGAVFLGVQEGKKQHELRMAAIAKHARMKGKRR